MTSVSICCNTTCAQRFQCAKFARAMDVNNGIIKNGYYIIDKCDFELWKKK